MKKRSFLTSLLGHLALLLVLVVNAHFATPPPVFKNTNQHDVISAVVLGDVPDSKIVPQKIQQAVAPPVKKTPIKVAKQTTPVAPKAKPQRAKKKEKVIALKKAKPKAKRKNKRKLAKKKRINKKKLAAARKRKKQRLAKLKKIKQQKALAAKFEKELQLQAEQTLRQHLLEEDLRLKGERARHAQGEVSKYKALILQAISENWLVPSHSDRKLVSELLIRLSPGGMVLDVQVTASSGDPALDSSARAAVLKASPLPVPKDPEAFRAFKRFVLQVKPENVV